jgi:hypothetical protein
VMAFVDDDLAFDTLGESRMMPHLVDWLRLKRWLRPDSVVVREFPINGRRVDLVTMTRSGVLSAFELKLGGFARVLEQAAYNRQNFDKSWIVVGIIVVTGAKPTVLLRPGSPDFDWQSRYRARKRLMEIGEIHV